MERKEAQKRGKRRKCRRKFTEMQPLSRSAVGLLLSFSFMISHINW
jgi:hypothetical protein